MATGKYLSGMPPSVGSGHDDIAGGQQSVPYRKRRGRFQAKSTARIFTRKFICRESLLSVQSEVDSTLNSGLPYPYGSLHPRCMGTREDYRASNNLGNRK